MLSFLGWALAINALIHLIIWGWIFPVAALAACRDLQPQLFSLDPNRVDLGNDQIGMELFHGYRILGSTPVSRPLVWLLIGSMKLGLLTHPLTFTVLCFWPRHGLRLAGWDLLICFQCCSFEVYRGASRVGRFPFMPWGLPFFNAILTARGVPRPTGD